MRKTLVETGGADRPICTHTCGYWTYDWEKMKAHLAEGRAACLPYKKKRLEMILRHFPLAVERLHREGRI